MGDYKLYAEDESYKLYQGKMQDVIDNCLEENSIDCILTDPPYGLTSITNRFGKEGSAPCQEGTDGAFKRLSKGFLGQTWDGTGVEYDVETWKRCLKVLKPGGYLLAFGGCYDEETEYLTKNGWKLIKDANKEDEIVTLNPNTHIIEFYKPNEIVKIPYNGKMYHFKTNKIDLNVTANHKMYIATLGRKENKYRLERADECYNKAIKMKKNAININQNQEYFILPSIEQSNGHYIYDTGEKKIPMNKWLKFFGLYIAQGSATINQRKVKISHYIKEDLDEIENDLKDYFTICRYDNIGAFTINNKQLCNYLHQFGVALTKHLPSYLKKLSSEQINLFIKWYCKGDGDRTFKRFMAYTSSKQLADDFQELALYAGISADIRKIKNKLAKMKDGRFIKGTNEFSYSITFNRKQNCPEFYKRHKQKEIIEITQRNDFVYCVEVPNHIIYVRRNGKAVWCGNTRTYHRIATAIENAGFEIREMIAWIYGSAMPKATDIGLMIDKRNGVKSKIVGYEQGSMPDFRDVGKKQKELGGLDKLTFGQIKNSERKEQPIYQAQNEWAGWKSGIKPCMEPIVMARKPFKGSLTDNVLENGVGALNIEECRIGDEVINVHNAPKGTFAGGERDRGSDTNSYREHSGRYPGNVIHDGSEEATQFMPNTKGSDTDELGNYGYAFGKERDSKPMAHGYNDEGSAARYFYCAKASSKDRDEGLDEFEKINIYKDGDASWGYANTQDDNFGDRIANVKRANIHPT